MDRAEEIHQFCKRANVDDVKSAVLSHLLMLNSLKIYHKIDSTKTGKVNRIKYYIIYLTTYIIVSIHNAQITIYRKLIIRV